MDAKDLKSERRCITTVEPTPISTQSCGRTIGPDAGHVSCAGLLITSCNEGILSNITLTPFVVPSGDVFGISRPACVVEEGPSLRYLTIIALALLMSVGAESHASAAPSRTCTQAWDSAWVAQSGSVYYASPGQTLHL